MTKPKALDEFIAVTWNVYAGTAVKVLEPILKQELAAGVSFFLMQEAGGADITRMLERNGLQTVVWGQYRLAWKPEVWKKLGWRHRFTSKVAMDSKRGKVRNEIIIGRFRHRPSRRKMRAVSYHTPAHVQRPEWNRDAPNRWRILKDAMALFKEMVARSRIRHQLFAGDDNVDETLASGGPLSRFAFMLNTGLKQVQAPRGTHGKNRKIDDFRIKGLVPVGEGSVHDGGGDHRLFRLRLRFVGRRRKKQR